MKDHTHLQEGSVPKVSSQANDSIAVHSYQRASECYTLRPVLTGLKTQQQANDQKQEAINDKSLPRKYIQCILKCIVCIQTPFAALSLNVFNYCFEGLNTDFFFLFNTFTKFKSQIGE